MDIAFGRDICGDLAAAERREWLVVNGLGGFASGTIAGTLTRRYHGLLIAALRPPVERTLLVTKIDEVATYRGSRYELAANRWKDDYVSPNGFTLIERFYFDGTMPVWHFALADAVLEKRVWMEDGANVSYVRYRVLRAAAPVALELKALVNARDFHGNTHAGDWHVNVAPAPRGLSVDAGNAKYGLYADAGSWTIENAWYRDFVLLRETERGLDDRDDNLAAGTLAVTLAPGTSVTVAAKEGLAPLDTARGDVGGDRFARRERELLTAWRSTPGAARAPDWMERCVLAASQFVVARPIENDALALSTIAGYHWFSDWGRDTMIALPGIALQTGRPQVARNILTTFASFVDGGMLPNVFPDRGQAPEYNTVDAALWYVEAAARYVTATGDLVTLRALLPSLMGVVRGYRDGTRYGIHVDPEDGLVAAGAPGVQLTWMDAKVGDWVVTPRIGKPVEISALWYNALHRMQLMLALAGNDDAEVRALLARVRFDRFWNSQTGYCYDVLDGPDGNDAVLRPNQLFGLSLPNAALDASKRQAVVDACAAQLVTSNGLRSLAPSEPGYCAHYGGSPHDRDAAYHQGTAWAWLLGTFAKAHARAYGDAEAARSFLQPLAAQLFDAGIGSISEIADATAPFEPRGAIAQAWSVAELIDAWCEIPAIAQAGSQSPSRQ